MHKRITPLAPVIKVNIYKSYGEAISKYPLEQWTVYTSDTASATQSWVCYIAFF